MNYNEKINYKEVVISLFNKGQAKFEDTVRSLPTSRQHEVIVHLSEDYFYRQTSVLDKRSDENETWYFVLYGITRELVRLNRENKKEAV